MTASAPGASAGAPGSVPSAGTDGSGSTDAPESAASRLFDIRLLIGALFVLYGVMLTVSGFFTSAAARTKASGININLWLGLGMLVFGVLFLIWRSVNPVVVEPAAAASEGEAAAGTSGATRDEGKGTASGPGGAQR